MKGCIGLLLLETVRLLFAAVYFGVACKMADVCCHNQLATHSCAALAQIFCRPSMALALLLIGFTINIPMHVQGDSSC